MLDDSTLILVGAHATELVSVNSELVAIDLHTRSILGDLDHDLNIGIKHLLERDTGIYLTNNEFKDAMLQAGYEPVDPNELNWHYRISKKSKAFALKVW